jgi:hypothetical protein
MQINKYLSCIIIIEIWLFFCNRHFHVRCLVKHYYKNLRTREFFVWPANSVFDVLFITLTLFFLGCIKCAWTLYCIWEQCLPLSFFILHQLTNQFGSSWKWSEPQIMQWTGENQQGVKEQLSWTFMLTE